MQIHTHTQLHVWEWIELLGLLAPTQNIMKVKAVIRLYAYKSFAHKKKGKKKIMIYAIK